MLPAGCQGALSGKGPVLAILPMLAPKRGLRVGPGGSALPLTSAALPGVLEWSGRGTLRLSPCAPSGRPGSNKGHPLLLVGVAPVCPRPGEQPSVPMMMRHRPPGSLALRVLKDDLAHAHDPDPD